MVKRAAKAAPEGAAVEQGSEMQVAAIETKVYADGTEATGPAPLPEQSPDEQASSEGAKPEVTDADVGGVMEPDVPPLNDFIKQMERDVQEEYGLAITKISHPEAEDGGFFQGTYAGIPLVKGEPGMLLSDGRGFGALERRDEATE